MAKVIVIGDSMLDIYVHGDVTRISPEAPVPILKETHRTYNLGGAANVAANLKALNVDVLLLTIVGTDVNTTVLDQLLNSKNINTYIDYYRGKTITKTRYVGNNQQILRVDEEKQGETNSVSEDKFLLAIETHFKSIAYLEYIILSDYNKGVLTPSLIRRIFALVEGTPVKVLVDTKKESIELFYGAHLITPNENELEKLIGVGTNIDEASDCVDYILVTKGPKGMTLVDRAESYDIPALKNTMVDVSGAGDTVIATMAYGLLNKKGDLLNIARLANLAASIVVNKSGTAVCSELELNHAIRRGELKHYRKEELISLVKEWKEDGLVVGFVNGCFDMLHAGHLNLLREAKKHCDRLIVAINSNESVTRLKGLDRPLNLEREKSLAAIPEVDAVIVFNESTPFDLIKNIQPNLHFVGPDYSCEQAVAIQEQTGIIIVPFLHLNKDISTSKIYDL